MNNLLHISVQYGFVIYLMLEDEDWYIYCFGSIFTWIFLLSMIYVHCQSCYSCPYDFTETMLFFFVIDVYTSVLCSMLGFKSNGTFYGFSILCYVGK